MAASAAGDYRASIPLFKEAESILRTSWGVAHWGYAAAKLGDTAFARATLAELERGTSHDRDVNIAAIYTALGDRTRAFGRLASGAAAGKLPDLGVDYRFDDLRNDSRYPPLARR